MNSGYMSYFVIFYSPCLLSPLYSFRRKNIHALEEFGTINIITLLCIKPVIFVNILFRFFYVPCEFFLLLKAVFFLTQYILLKVSPSLYSSQFSYLSPPIQIHSLFISHQKEKKTRLLRYIIYKAKLTHQIEQNKQKEKSQREGTRIIELVQPLRNTRKPLNQKP